MHCEKNLIELVMNIMFGEGDTISVWKDMKHMNIWNGLWPIAKRKEGEFTLPVAPYVLQLEEKKTFIHIIEELKTPISYLSTLKKQIHMGISKLKGLKAHDYHVLMQQILPLCVHTFMPRGFRLDIIRMSQVFQRLCAKPIDPSMMNDLKQEATNTLCLLEK